MISTNEKMKAAVFFWIIRPIMNRIPSLRDAGIVDCPCCGRLLEYYPVQGFLHLSDGDADCFGALGKGKGFFK